MKPMTGLIAAAATLAPVAALADPEGGYGDWGGHMWGGGYGMIFGPFFMLLWLGVIVFLLVLAFRWLGGTGGGGGLGKSEDTALTTLRARYARGEIDTQEYEERLRTLQG